jgi:hypothetical protein
LALLLLHTEAVVVASKEIGVDYAGKTKYTVMSRGQNAGQNYDIKIGNEAFEGVEHFTVWEHP